MHYWCEYRCVDVEVRLDEAEAAALRGGKKIIAKLEERIRALEQELDAEQRRSSDMEKEIKKGDRRIKELEFQVYFAKFYSVPCSWSHNMKKKKLRPYCDHMSNELENEG